MIDSKLFSLQSFDTMLDDHGLATLIVVAGLYLATIFGIRWINKYFEKKIKIDLVNHPFFTKMDTFKRIIEMIHVHNELKKEMIVDFFKLSITIFRNGMKELLMNTKSFSCLSNSELSCLFLTKVNQLLSQYDDEAKKKGIPNYFMQVFNEHHQGTIMVMIEDIDSIANNEIYGTQEQKAYVMLDSIKNAFHIMIKDAKISMDAINGQLKNEFYNNKRIGDYDPPSHH